MAHRGSPSAMMGADGNDIMRADDACTKQWPAYPMLRNDWILIVGVAILAAQLSCREQPNAPQESQSGFTDIVCVSQSTESARGDAGASLVSGPANPSPPDLSRCTRIEIRFYPSIRRAFLIAEGILSREEMLYVDSLESYVIDDPNQIRAFAHDLSLVSYWKSGIGLAQSHLADICCYCDQEHVTSFKEYVHHIRTESGDWFENRGVFSSQKYTVQLWPLIKRTACSHSLIRLHHVFQTDTWGTAEYPPPTEWCDATLRKIRETRMHADFTSYLQCHGAVPKHGRSDYAMNPDCKRDSPPDVVFLFESKPGWNQYGGPELFTFDNHDPRGGLVLLNDGTVKFIRTEEELKQLRWK